MSPYISKTLLPHIGSFWCKFSFENL